MRTQNLLLQAMQLLCLMTCVTEKSLSAIPGISWLQEQFTLMQCQKHCSSDTPEVTPICPDKKATLMMYQLMKDVHNVFMRYGITYWVDSGTLLGATRHKGIIPWDDDLDICIDKKDIQNVLALEPFFNAIGYDMYYPLRGVIKISPKEGTPVKYLGFYSLKTPHIDILFTENRDDKIYFSPTIFTYMYWVLHGDYGLFGYRNNDEIFITRDELYPLKEYQLGEIKVMGAQNPMPYLYTLYGNDCMDVGYQWHNHEDGLQKIKAGKITLTEKDKVPAQPTGPLRETPF